MSRLIILLTLGWLGLVAPGVADDCDARDAAAKPIIAGLVANKNQVAALTQEYVEQMGLTNYTCADEKIVAIRREWDEFQRQSARALEFTDTSSCERMQYTQLTALITADQAKVAEAVQSWVDERSALQGLIDQADPQRSRTCSSL